MLPQGRHISITTHGLKLKSLSTVLFIRDIKETTYAHNSFQKFVNAVETNR